MQSRLVLLWIGVVIGALLICGAPVLAMLEMQRVFTVLDSNGISDPHQLSRAVAGTMIIIAGGLLLFPIGLVLLIVCAVLLKQSRHSGPPPLPRFPENLVSPPKKD